MSIISILSNQSQSFRDPPLKASSWKEVISGLVYVPYFTARYEERYFVEFYHGGGLIELRRVPVHKEKGRKIVGDRVRVRGGGKRGKIKRFSKRSRFRLLRLVSMLDRRKVDPKSVLFITLTYPGSGHGDERKAKRDLDVFGKRFRRKFPGVPFIWKKEPQKRGAIHYHLMVVGVRFIDKEWVSRVWYEVVGSGDERHLRAGTRVERARSWKGVVAYVAKYMGKEVEGEGEGRWWGVVNRAALERLISKVILKVRGEVWELLQSWLAVEEWAEALFRRGDRVFTFFCDCMKWKWRIMELLLFSEI